MSRVDLSCRPSDSVWVCWTTLTKRESKKMCIVLEQQRVTLPVGFEKILFRDCLVD